MEIANLRLKFTPTLKDIEHSNTKCCLEIVPEISYVKNIDKIEWKSDSDSIVYVIPMTYKIILRKKRSEDVNTALDKTYHSCVDLLPPSSLSNINFASGDVNRFISDTFIVSTMTANFNNDEKKEETVNMHVYQSNTNKTEECVTIKANTSNKMTIGLLDEAVNTSGKANVELCDEAVSVSSKDQYEPENGIVSPTAEVTIKYEDDEEQSKSEYTADNIEPFKKDNVTNNITTEEVVTKRKLSITPICSVDTTDSITKLPDTKSFDVAFDSFDSVYLRLFNNESLHNAKNLISRNKNLQMKNVFLHKPISYLDTISSFCVEDRERPETKVAKFVKKMESEIMPLKVMLNDILRKCSKLGLINKENTLRKPVSPVSLVNQNLSKNMNVTNVCWREVQPKSNRVVYSIVFDT